MFMPLTVSSPGLAALRALNNAHAQELSFADEARFAHLVKNAFFAAHIGTEAFIIAFDQDSDYDSPNFLWFKARFPKFVYVDRVVASPASRGRGHGRALYEALFQAAKAAGHERVTCEINADPPNPGSDAFHAKLGFTEIGMATLPGGQKTVRYFERAL